MKNRAQFRPFQCSENCHTPVYCSAWDNNPCQFSLKPLSLTLTSTLSYGKKLTMGSDSAQAKVYASSSSK